MFNFHFSYRYLFFRPPLQHLPTPLPDGIVRLFTDTPSGKVEILYAAPKGDFPDKNVSPLFFVHGGMGSAWVWLKYMTYLSQRGVPCYAVSMRGHGESWYPSYLRMVWLTTKRNQADDVVAGIRFAQAREGGGEVVLVGHSSGGGLSQYILSEGDVTVKGLALMGGVPGFGALGVSDAYMEEFERHMNPYECFWWPLTMIRAFASFPRILAQIKGWDEGHGARVLVLHGEHDKLITLPVMSKLTSAFRDTYRQSVREKSFDARKDYECGIVGAGGEETQADGVRFCCVPGAGHHMQNDVGWEVGAQKLLEFYQHL